MSARDLRTCAGADEHLAKIIKAGQFREGQDRYSKRIGVERIAEESYNLNISRYIGTATADEEIGLTTTNAKRVEMEVKIQDAKDTLNAFLREPGLPLLP